MIKATPYGNSLTTDFALAAIEGEAMGADEYTDFLAISYSSTDYVGHRFGVKAVETEDTYLRLDKDLERLLDVLDKKVGEGSYVVFLTADHGASYNPVYLNDNRIPGGFLEPGSLQSGTVEFARNRFGTADIIRMIAGGEVYLRHEVVDSLGLDLHGVQETLGRHLLGYAQVEKVFTAHQLKNNANTSGIASLMQKGYNEKLSADLFYVAPPSVISKSYAAGGTSHGSPYIFDTHVPFILFGKGIKIGESLERTVIPDIAPTLAAFLGIPFPNGSTGTVRYEAFQ